MRSTLSCKDSSLTRMTEAPLLSPLCLSLSPPLPTTPSPAPTLHHGLTVLLHIRVQPPLVRRKCGRPRPVRPLQAAPLGAQQRPVRLIASSRLPQLMLRDHVQGVPEGRVQLVVLVILLAGVNKSGKCESGAQCGVVRFYTPSVGNGARYEEDCSITA